MNRILILVLIPAACILHAACVTRRSEPLTQRQFIPSTERIANGERVYMQYCQPCHPGGESGLAPAINSNPAPQFVKRFQVRHGLGVMPAFSREIISVKELRDISKFLRAWKKY